MGGGCRSRSTVAGVSAVRQLAPRLPRGRSVIVRTVFERLPCAQHAGHSEFAPLWSRSVDSLSPKPEQRDEHAW